MMDDEHSPIRHESFNHQMGGHNNPSSRFWSSANDRTGKVDEFNPKHGNGVVNWREKGPATNKIYRDDRSIPRDYEPKKDASYETSYVDNKEKPKGNGYSSPRAEVYEEETHAGVIDSREAARKYGDVLCFMASRPPIQTITKYAPPDRGYVTTQPKQDTSYDDNNGYSSPRYSGPGESQPRKEAYYGQSNDSSRRTGPPLFTTISEIPSVVVHPTMYDNEKRKENVYFAPPYRGSVTTQPKQDTSYDDTNGKYKRNGYSSPRYSGPGESQQRKDAYYGPLSNDSPRLTGTPPIKTRSDTGRLSKSENNSPVAIAGQQGFSTSSPRKYEGYPETIDSAEARRRYAKGSPRAEVYREETHAGVIDSREAARKYQGVFVPSGRPF